MDASRDRSFVVAVANEINKILENSCCMIVYLHSVLFGDSVNGVDKAKRHGFHLP